MDNNMSKADILVSLKGKLREASVEDIKVFTVKEWMEKKPDILGALVGMFSPHPVVVRSSSRKEDTEKTSQAGCFYSGIGINSASSKALAEEIEKVITSYKDKNTVSLDDQVIVQTETQNVAVSGVIFTRGLGTNAPYYVINYDDVSGKTDTVTGGVVGSMVCIYRGVKEGTGRWGALLAAVKEIERHFAGVPLDIEFAVKDDGKVVIFLVRLLSANIDAEVPDDVHMQDLIDSMKAKFLRFSRRVPHLGGRRTIFGDMPDWNPAEMIGNRPNTLDYSLYSFLITDSVWHEARSTLGYRDVYPGDLMISFGKRPYIDTRVSFNSLVPERISDKLCDKLIDHYLDKLEAHPEKQDKVEFEIVWSCFHFSLEREMGVLRGKDFDDGEINEIKESLFDITNSMIESSGDLFARDIDLVSHLTQRKNKILSGRDSSDLSPWTLFYIAYNLLQNCKKFGILPFARLARMAFIGKSILISLRDEKIISTATYHGLLNSIQTVASSLSEDLGKLQEGKSTLESFLNSYGHLRPGTYDITALRYCDMDGDIFAKSLVREGSGANVKNYKVPAAEMKAIDEELARNKFSAKSEELLAFITKAIELREKAKLEFTRTLSEALEFIALAGKQLGFTREDLSQVDLTTLMKFRNPEYADIEYSKNAIRQSLERHKKEKKWSDALILPPVIADKKDFEMVSFYKARPNFITEKIVSGPVLEYDKDKIFSMGDMSGHIIFLENADPGYDWIFAKNPRGIVTKYGGVASHMAIRCAEFGIPAAIGCGATLYDNLARSSFVVIDGAKQTLKHMKE